MFLHDFPPEGCCISSGPCDNTADGVAEPTGPFLTVPEAEVRGQGAGQVFSPGVAGAGHRVVAGHPSAVFLCPEPAPDAALRGSRLRLCVQRDEVPLAQGAVQPLPMSLGAAVAPPACGDGARSPQGGEAAVARRRARCHALALQRVLGEQLPVVSPAAGRAPCPAWAAGGQEGLRWLGGSAV